MENQKARLIDLIDISDSACDGIEGIYVESVDIFKTKGVINVMVSGSDSLTTGDTLALFMSELDGYYKNRVSLSFTDVKDIGRVFNVIVPLIKYVITRDYDSEILRQIGSVGISFADGEISISMPAYWAKFYSESEIREFISVICDVCKAITGIDPSKDPSVSVKPVYISADIDESASPEEIIRRAKEGGTYYENDGNYEKAGKRKKKTEGQSDKPAETEEEPKDKKLSTSSWEYKAKQGLKEAEAEGGEKKDFRRSANAEDAIFGKVRTEAKLTKSCKSVVAKFMVMDDTDAISCIAFLKPEEADGFEKKFGKGGFAGFQGNVETETFSGEKQLKVFGAFPADKPEGRKSGLSVQTARSGIQRRMPESLRCLLSGSN